MKPVALLYSEILGTTSGEHSGHDEPPCSPTTLTGHISNNVSPFVFVDGVPLAFKTSTTIEFDSCCGSNRGSTKATTTLLYHKDIPVSRLDDEVATHSGSAKIVTASTFVFSD